MPKLSAPIACLLLMLAGYQAQAETQGKPADGFQPDHVGIYPRLWQGFLVDLPAPPT